jgi:adenine-specific DNA-methyltransferase
LEINQNHKLSDFIDLLVELLPSPSIPIFESLLNQPLGDFHLWKGDVLDYLDQLPDDVKFDLIVTSPPYNLGKEYEERDEQDSYIEWQRTIIQRIVPRLKDTGSICWQVGNYIENGSIWPLDISIAPIFKNEFHLQLRNRIVWRFGHGLHAQKRFSGRYEVVLWFTKANDYTFNLDPVRIPSKYPSKKHFKGPKIGQYSSNPKGKNPEDVWDIPNVKGNHIEKTGHPCQFPVGLIEMLVLSMTNEGDLVFDPFAGSCSAGVAAALHNRRFYGSDIVESYLEIGKQRIEDALAGRANYRPFNKPIYDHTKSKLSQKPEENNP